MNSRPTPPPLLLGEHILDFSRTRLMGVINVTPDSFSDGGRFLTPDSAFEQAKRLRDEGADLLDVGGESTRPGAEQISVATELERVLPVIEKLSALYLPISIDTCKPEVARSALAAGAHLINDISGLGDQMLEVARDHKCPVVAMHMQGDPRSMQKSPSYANVVEEVRSFLQARMLRAQEEGVRVVLDPGIGFGKTLDHNLELLANLDRLTELGAPLLVGVSRKSFLGKITDTAVSDRLEPSIGASVAAALAGAHILRVHDVEPHRRALDVVDAVRAHRPRSGQTAVPPHHTITQIDRLVCDTRIGITPEERAQPQPVVLHIEAQAGAPAADRIEEAVDYAALIRVSRQFAEQGERQLLETLARDIALALLDGFPVERVTVKASKPQAAAALEVGDIAVATVARK